MKTRLWVSGARLAGLARGEDDAANAAVLREPREPAEIGCQQPQSLQEATGIRRSCSDVQRGRRPGGHGPAGSPRAARNGDTSPVSGAHRGQSGSNHAVSAAPARSSVIASR